MTLLDDEFEPSERRHAKGSLSDSHLREARARPELSLSISSVLVWRGAVGGLAYRKVDKCLDVCRIEPL